MDEFSTPTHHLWAHETFGDLSVGSRARTKRVVAMAALLARRPGGTVTQVFERSADREGAYRLLSSECVSAEALGDAMCDATLRRCDGQPFVFVPVDGTSLKFTNRKGSRDVGSIGSRKMKAQGLLVQSALAVAPDGTPLGLCEQRFWARKHRSRVKGRAKTEEKETQHFVDLLVSVQARFVANGQGVVPLFQCDRGYDCWPILQLSAQGVQMSVRAQYNRRLSDGPRGEKRYLIETLEGSAVHGHYNVEVAAGEGRTARLARMSVRALRVGLVLKVGRRRREVVEMNAVLATEERGPAKGKLRWMLLTTMPIGSMADIEQVLCGYESRWRIEEFHRAWKSGGCNVEDSQLRSRGALMKWATLHAAVATRAVHLAYLARSKPETPALEEFTETELEAVRVLKSEHTKVRLGSSPTLSQVVVMIAELGGYTGKSSGGPPGPTVLARGLKEVAMAAKVLRILGRK